MDALSSFDNALLCFFNEVLLKKIEKHSAAVHLPRRRIRRQMLRFNDLKDGKMLWTTFKWLVNTSFRNVNKDVALDIQDNRVGNNTPKTSKTKLSETVPTYENDENQNYFNTNPSTSFNTVLTSIRDTFISPSSWTNIRNELAGIYYEFPTLVEDFDKGNCDYRVRTVLELMVSIAVHSDNNEFYVKKIMSLRQDMQHMLMIAIQRQYVPSALQLEDNSPVKINPSLGTYENDEELTQDPEDFVQATKEKDETISATENINAATPLNHTRNEIHMHCHNSEKNIDNFAFENDHAMTNTMTPQKFFNTPFGKNKRTQRFDSNVKKKDSISPSMPAMASKLACQKKHILGMEKELAAAKATIARLNKKNANQLILQEEMATIIEDQNTEIKKLKTKAAQIDDLQTRNLSLSDQLEDLENVDHLCKVATDKAEKANQTIAKLTKELKSLKGKLAEEKDLEIDRVELDKIIAEKEKLENQEDHYRCQFHAKKIRCDQLEWQLAEEKAFLLQEKAKRRDEARLYVEKEKISTENIRVLERSVSQLQSELRSTKDDMLAKLSAVRREHKKAIVSYESAFHQKLAEVCRQRDEYAEVADQLRSKIEASE